MHAAKLKSDLNMNADEEYMPLSSDNEKEMQKDDSGRVQRAQRSTAKPVQYEESSKEEDELEVQESNVSAEDDSQSSETSQSGADESKGNDVLGGPSQSGADESVQYEESSKEENELEVQDSSQSSETENDVLAGPSRSGADESKDKHASPLNQGAAGDYVVYLHKVDVDGLVYLYVGVILELGFEADVLFYKTEDRVCSNNNHTQHCLEFKWRTPVGLGLEPSDHICWVDSRAQPGEKSTSLILYVGKSNIFRKQNLLKKAVIKAASNAILKGSHCYMGLIRKQSEKGWREK